MARRKNFSKNFIPAISPEMPIGEKELKALLGVKLAPYWREFELLRAFYAAEAKALDYSARREINHADGRKTLEEMMEETPGKISGAYLRELEEKQLLVDEMVREALAQRDTSFFSRMAEMVPLAAEKRNPVAPVDYALVNLYRWMNEAPRGRSGARARARYQGEFPEWPPTISRLEEYLKKLGEPYVSPARTIRDAVKRLGFEVQSGKPGRKARGEK